MEDDEENLLLMMLLDSKSRKQRSVWVRESLEDRGESGEFAAFWAHERNHVDEFYSSYRMSPARFDQILASVEARLKHQDTNYRAAIPSAERLAITIRYLATGMSQKEVARYFRVGRSTISKIIPEVCEALWEGLAPAEMPKPDAARWLSIAEEYERRWNFPNCLGAIDGKHIHIQCPQLSGSSFYNYKSTFSTVLMAIVDADYCFTYIDVGAYGGQHDNTIFQQSSFGQQLAAGGLDLPGERMGLGHVFVADEAFQLRDHILRPYPGKYVGPERRRRLIYNYRLCRARRVVENTFGILVSKWRIFRQPIIAKVETVDAIVKASCVLHNFLRRRDGESNDTKYITGEAIDDDENGELGEAARGSWRQQALGTGVTAVRRMGSNNAARQAFDMRERFADYFMSPEGSVSWQDNVVNRGQLNP